MTVGTAVKRRASHLGPERRRPLVLDAAMEIALADGIPAVTIEAIAARLGVTRPVVYACYANRIDLLTALLEREERTLLEGVLSAYPAPGSFPKTEAAYVAGMQALLGTVAAHPDTWRMLFCANPGRDVAETFSRGRRRIAEQFERLVRPDLVRWGTVDAERKAPVLVELFVSMAESAVRSLLDADNAHTAEELGELVGRAAFRAIRGA
ncbi:TetR/AcrR family transcriptional regulator [Mycolicibacterium canariasense]|uniref:TetR/AcrR family transcriptional regulator n=1 Tax=Mycolicibacterium canariasense TaxID=228230 RepID=UPI000A5905AB|nr:TetR/AcrR family transcriptional regulator [Mycolicibacterium canariasense]MCV7209702.1 TetR/AcrR family transcriptional regulator [Mycolicibacterium canariasense]